jgi:Fic family protein
MAWSLSYLEQHLLVGSTLVEGSTLTESEAHDVLAGRTITGHPLREHREIWNHRAAIEWLIRELDASPYLSVDLVLGLHRRLLDGLEDEAGTWKAHGNFTVRSTGERHDYQHPARVPDSMREWVAAFNEAPEAGEPVAQAAELYARFQQIHPFQDGNGRIGRILIAYFLHWKHGLSFRFYASHKLEHLRAVEASDDGDMQPLVAFLGSVISKEGA